MHGRADQGTWLGLWATPRAGADRATQGIIGTQPRGRPPVAEGSDVRRLGRGSVALDGASKGQYQGNLCQVGQRPAEQLDYLASLLKRMAAINTDQQLFDFVLLKVLETYLWDIPYSGQKPPKAARSLSSGEALVTLLRCVAAYGHTTGDEALAAFKAGISSVKQARSQAQPPSFESLDQARDLTALDAALARLASLKPAARRKVLAAVLACIRHDHHIQLAEHESFRAIAATLGCPVPPTTSITANV